MRGRGENPNLSYRERKSVKPEPDDEAVQRRLHLRKEVIEKHPGVFRREDKFTHAYEPPAREQGASAGSRRTAVADEAAEEEEDVQWGSPAEDESHTPDDEPEQPSSRDSVRDPSRERSPDSQLSPPQSRESSPPSLERRPPRLLPRRAKCKARAQTLLLRPKSSSRRPQAPQSRRPQERARSPPWHSRIRESPDTSEERPRQRQNRKRSRSPRRSRPELVLTPHAPDFDSHNQAEQLQRKTLRMSTALQESMDRRGAVAPAPAAVAEPGRALDLVDVSAARAWTPSEGPLPATVGEGNFMVATWIIGKEANASEMYAKLKRAPQDIVVLIMSDAIDQGDAIFVSLLYLAQIATDPFAPESVVSEQIRSFLNEKSCYRLAPKVFALIHKGKVTSCTHSTWATKARDVPDPRPQALHLATLNLVLDHTRQRMTDMTLGILYTQDKILETDLDGLVQWVLQSRMALLTGYFRENYPQLREIAQRAGAIFYEPFAQWVRLPSNVRCHECLAPIPENTQVTHPSYFLAFGYYRAIKIQLSPRPPEDWVFGEDILAEMIRYEQWPTWPCNDEGCPLVRNLGTIKTKDPDWRRWCHGTFQTALWIGTSMPSKSAVRKWHRGKGKGKRPGPASGERPGPASLYRFRRFGKGKRK